MNLEPFLSICRFVGAGILLAVGMVVLSAAVAISVGMVKVALAYKPKT